MNETSVQQRVKEASNKIIIGAKDISGKITKQSRKGSNIQNGK